MAHSIRMSPEAVAQLQRHRPTSDAPPKAAKPGRAPRHPVLADHPREPTRLLHVTVTAPKQKGGGWTVTAEYNDGAVTVNVPTQEKAEEIKTEMEKAGTL